MATRIGLTHVDIVGPLLPITGGFALPLTAYFTLLSVRVVFYRLRNHVSLGEDILPSNLDHDSPSASSSRSPSTGPNPTLNPTPDLEAGVKESVITDDGKRHDHDHNHDHDHDHDHDHKHKHKHDHDHDGGHDHDGHDHKHKHKHGHHHDGGHDHKHHNHHQAQHESLLVAVRAHGNFSENVPLALLLAAIAELNGANKTALTLVLGSLLISRVVHVEFGLRRNGAMGRGRAVGYYGTMGVMGFLAAYAAWLVKGFWVS